MKMRSHCPVNYALEHFGDKWSLLIIRDLMFKNKRHYNEFFEAEEKVSTSVLGSRLRSLEEAGIISKGEDGVKKSRIRYSLTRKGINLLPLMTELILWSNDFDVETATDEGFIKNVQEGKADYLANLEKKLIQEHLKE
ncbi:hypothetical protein BKI52_06755 [marine bacterium AO1-C]|nr:hypothetical protein BKI52_06755 [marine bacterium AO1-C]